MNTRDLRFRTNRAGDIVALLHEELDPLYGRAEVSVFCEMLFEAYLGWSKTQLLTGRERTVDQSDLLRFHWALEDLKRYRPIQHIIGHVDFCGCRIAVGPEVLIPRPETAEMAEWLVGALHDPRPGLRILDLCTGSGCIAIALKKAFPLAQATAVDVSEAALATARRNAAANEAEVQFVQGDVLGGLDGLEGQYGLVVGNPPYVRESERTAMQPNVLDHEPSLALFVPDDDPLRFHRAIAAMARRRLVGGGMLAMEINEALADETCAVVRGQGFSPTVHDDFRGRPRWVSAVWNP